MKKHLAVMVALSVMLGVGAPVAKDLIEPTTVEASSFSYTQEQQQALNHINKLRRGMGLNPVTLNPFLTEASQNHAEYLTINGQAGRDFHEQVKGTTGFTGESVVERLRTVGYKGKSATVGEVIDRAGRTPEAAVDRIFYGPYHRVGLTNPVLEEVGIGVDVKGIVINTQSGEHDWNAPEVVFPYDGQTGVGTRFMGDERPNPLKQFNVGSTGYVLSYTPQGSRELKPGSQKFTLKDSKGKVQPTFIEESVWGLDAFFYPKSYLKYGETYTAHFEFVYDDTGKKGSKTWTFTTETEDGKPVNPKPTEPTKPTPKPSPSLKDEYADYRADAYWTENMEWAISKGLISGFRDVKNTKTGKLENLLRPETNLTESQLLTVLFRYTNNTELQNLLNNNKLKASPVYIMADKYNLPTKSNLKDTSHTYKPVTRGLVAQIILTKHFGKFVDERTAVQFFIENGLTSMKTYADYKPNSNLTRAHAVTFMRNFDKLLSSGKEVSLPRLQYADFRAGQHWSENMLWAIDKGMISGYQNVKNKKTGKVENLLQPNANLTEAQFIAVLFRYAQPEQMNTIQPIDGWWASVGYQLAERFQIPTKASPTNKNGSGHTMTRGEVAIAIATMHHGRVMNLRDSVDFMYKAGISNGYDKTNKTFENYGAKDNLTRAHIVTFMKNYDTYVTRWQ